MQFPLKTNHCIATVIYVWRPDYNSYQVKGILNFDSTENFLCPIHHRTVIAATQSVTSESCDHHLLTISIRTITLQLMELGKPDVLATELCGSRAPRQKLVIK